MDYRREIDGLRALAVLPVIFFHSDFNAFSGGFVGVDVFFVISGYLITSIILTEKEAGTFSLLGFYERRARRILPALFLVMLVCIPFAWLWLLPHDMKAFSESLVAVTAFVSNHFFWSESGYFDASSELNPLLHTWSLAVEEQYYVLFPVFLMLTWKLGKKRIVVLLIPVTIGSLAVAQWGVFYEPKATFYLLATRGWEILVGVLVSFYLFSKKKDKIGVGTTDQLASLLGVSLILFGVFTFSQSTRFPGFNALVPTLGTALVILFANPQTFVGKFLGNKWLVSVGLISYSAYLWHQPLLALRRYRYMSEPSTLVSLISIVLIFILAFISWRFVETPFRQKQRFSRMQIFGFWLVFSVGFVIVGLGGHFTKGYEKRFEISRGDYFWSDHVKCSYPTKGYERLLCEKHLQRNAGGKTILFMGDSILSASSEGIVSAASALGLKVSIAPKWGCPSLLGVTRAGMGEGGKRCGAFNKRLFDFIKDEKITHVVLFSVFNRYLRNGKAGSNANQDICASKDACIQEFRDALLETVKFFEENHIKYYFVKQPPDYNILGTSYENINRLFYWGGFNEVQMPKPLYDSDSSIFSKLIPTDKVISFEEIFCNDSLCSPIVDGQMYYVNGDHFGKKGAKLLESFWVKRLLLISNDT